ncbi:lipopolysaccharide assembly protein LapA domain-containing protein [Candidatus Omnitrophota bacterium]
MRWKVWFALGLLLLLFIFVAQNYEVVNINFLFWSFKTSRAIVVFSSLVTGIIIGWIGAALRRR